MPIPRENAPSVMDKLQQGIGRRRIYCQPHGETEDLASPSALFLITNHLSEACEPGGYCHFHLLISAAGAHQLLSPVSQMHLSPHHPPLLRAPCLGRLCLELLHAPARIFLLEFLPVQQPREITQLRGEITPVFILCPHLHHHKSQKMARGPVSSFAHSHRLYAPKGSA